MGFRDDAPEGRSIPASGRRALWLVIGVLLVAGVNYVTSKVARGHRFAVTQLFGSTVVADRIGSPAYLILLGSSSRGSGTLSCDEYYYLAHGATGTAFVRLRALQASQRAPFIVGGLKLGYGNDFSTGCREALGEFARAQVAGEPFAFLVGELTTTRARQQIALDQMAGFDDKSLSALLPYVDDERLLASRNIRIPNSDPRAPEANYQTTADSVGALTLHFLCWRTMQCVPTALTDAPSRMQALSALRRYLSARK
ncbi:MAG TPA: hypothetical protein VGC21_25700 [Telluria sp.]|jgi:hypothetical protein